MYLNILFSTLKMLKNSYYSLINKEIPCIIDTCTTVHKICEIRFYVAHSIFNMVCQPVPLLTLLDLLHRS